ncbi:hypothetical protein [Nostoc sp.]|uniref:hypothetical protein n=1 Tax=Nostoc sp. TaxID=1180 RepID=UPI002FFC9A4F
MNRSQLTLRGPRFGGVESPSERNLLPSPKGKMLKALPPAFVNPQPLPQSSKGFG